MDSVHDRRRGDHHDHELQVSIFEDGGKHDLRNPHDRLDYNYIAATKWSCAEGRPVEPLLGGHAKFDVLDEASEHESYKGIA